MGRRVRDPPALDLGLVEEVPRTAVRRRGVGERPAVRHGDRTVEPKDMIGRVLRFERAPHDLLLSGGSDVLGAPRVRSPPAESVDRSEQDCPHARLDCPPLPPLRILRGLKGIDRRPLGNIDPARQQNVLSRIGVLGRVDTSGRRSARSESAPPVRTPSSGSPRTRPSHR